MTKTGVEFTWIKQDYDLIADYKASPHAVDKIIGYDLNNIDKEFLVFRKKGAPSKPIPGLTTNSGPLLNPLVPNEAS
jgi:hypothetical protein